MEAADSSAAETSAQSENQEQQWIQVNRKSKRQKRNDRKLRQVLRMTDIFEEPQRYFISIYMMRFPGADINKDINIVQTD